MRLTYFGIIDMSYFSSSERFAIDWATKCSLLTVVRFWILLHEALSLRIEDMEFKLIDVSAILSMSRLLFKCLARPRQILLLVAEPEWDETGSSFGEMGAG